MRLVKALITAAAAVALSVGAWAGMILPSSLQKMTWTSDAIVVGRVASQTAASEGGKIYTNVVVGVSDWLKAASPARPETVTLKIPGGTSGGYTMKVDLAPSFADGEEVLLFLRKSGTNYVPYALNYGVVRLTVSGDGLTTQAGGPLFSTGQVYDFTAKKMVLNTVPYGGEPLSSFKNRISDAIAKGAE